MFVIILNIRNKTIWYWLVVMNRRTVIEIRFYQYVFKFSKTIWQFNNYRLTLYIEKFIKPFLSS